MTERERLDIRLQPTPRVAGEIDAVTVERFQRFLEVVERSSNGRVVIDLSGVTFIDSNGLGAIAAAASNLTSTSKLVLVNVPSHVRRLLSITAIDTVVDVQDDATV